MKNLLKGLHLLEGSDSIGRGVRLLEESDDSKVVGCRSMTKGREGGPWAYTVTRYTFGRKWTGHEITGLVSGEESEEPGVEG